MEIVVFELITNTCMYNYLYISYEIVIVRSEEVRTF
jgi:hypothetical protein